MEETVKFYLVEQMQFTLVLVVQQRGMEAETIAISPTLLSRKIRGVRCVDGEGSDSSASLQKHLTDKISSDNSQVLKWTFKLHCIKDFDFFTDTYEIGKTEFLISFDTTTGMKDVLEEAAFLQAEITELRMGSSGDTGQQFSTTEMPVPAHLGNNFAFIDSSYNAVIDNLLVDRNFEVIIGKMNIILIVNSNIAGVPSHQEKTAVFKRMLDEELGADAVILTSSGDAVNCHRGILAAHSDVFQTLFAADMKEAQTGKIELPDMSEEGVRAFLAYLYHWDQCQAEKMCSVAVELLKAGHKYNIHYLEKAMQKLLLSKPDAWYDSVDVAMKLFLFVHKMNAEWDSLKKKAVMVMKMNTADLKKSTTFQELFQTDPDAAMDFCQYAITM